MFQDQAGDRLFFYEAGYNNCDNDVCKQSKKRTLPERKKICDNKHVEKDGVKMTREGRDWDSLIKQFIKRESTESVNEFCRKHNVGVAEL